VAYITFINGTPHIVRLVHSHTLNTLKRYRMDRSHLRAGADAGGIWALPYKRHFSAFSSLWRIASPANHGFSLPPPANRKRTSRKNTVRRKPFRFFVYDYAVAAHPMNA